MTTDYKLPETPLLEAEPWLMDTLMELSPRQCQDLLIDLCGWYIDDTDFVVALKHIIKRGIGAEARKKGRNDGSL